MEVRLILCACIIIGCTMCGKAMSSNFFKRVETLDMLIEGIKRLNVRMSKMFEPIGEALSHTECPPFARVAEDIRHGTNVRKAWENNRIQMSGRGKLFSGLQDDDLKIMDAFFEKLGDSGRDEQEILLSTTVESLREIRVLARRKALETGKLYVTIGFLLGLMISIIVI